MLGQRWRRCANIDTALGECPVFMGYLVRSQKTRDVDQMLDQCWTNIGRWTSWTNIVSTLDQWFLLAGMEYGWVEMKLKEWGFGTPFYTSRLNCAKRTSWGWWDEWDDTTFQTQDPSEAEHATSRSQRFPTIESLRVSGKETFCSLKLQGQRNPRSPTFQAGSFNHRAPAKGGGWRKLDGRFVLWLVMLDLPHQWAHQQTACPDRQNQQTETPSLNGDQDRHTIRPETKKAEFNIRFTKRARIYRQILKL